MYKIISSNKNYINNNHEFNLSLFKFVYKRYTFFSKQFYIKSLSNNIFDNNLRVEIDKFGDLISNLILNIKLPSVSIPKTTNDFNNDYQKKK